MGKGKGYCFNCQNQEVDQYHKAGTYSTIKGRKLSKLTTFLLFGLTLLKAPRGNSKETIQNG